MDGEEKVNLGLTKVWAGIFKTAVNCLARGEDTYL